MVKPTIVAKSVFPRNIWREKMLDTPMFCGKNHGFLDIFPWTNSVTVKGVPYLRQVPYHMVQHVLQHVSWSNHRFWCLHHTKSHYHNHNEAFWLYLPTLLIVSQILFVESPFLLLSICLIINSQGLLLQWSQKMVGFPTVLPLNVGETEVSPWCSRAALVPTTAGATPWWPMRRRSQRPGRNWAATMGRSSMCPGFLGPINGTRLMGMGIFFF